MKAVSWSKVTGHFCWLLGVLMWNSKTRRKINYVLSPTRVRQCCLSSWCPHYLKIKCSLPESNVSGGRSEECIASCTSSHCYGRPLKKIYVTKLNELKLRTLVFKQCQCQYLTDHCIGFGLYAKYVAYSFLIGGILWAPTEWIHAARQSMLFSGWWSNH